MTSTPFRAKLDLCEYGRMFVLVQPLYLHGKLPFVSAYLRKAPMSALASEFTLI